MIDRVGLSIRRDDSSSSSNRNAKWRAYVRGIVLKLPRDFLHRNFRFLASLRTSSDWVLRIQKRFRYSCYIQRYSETYNNSQNFRTEFNLERFVRQTIDQMAPIKNRSLRCYNPTSFALISIDVFSFKILREFHLWLSGNFSSGRNRGEERTWEGRCPGPSFEGNISTLVWCD